MWRKTNAYWQYHYHIPSTSLWRQLLLAYILLSLVTTGSIIVFTDITAKTTGLLTVTSILIVLSGSIVLDYVLQPLWHLHDTLQTWHVTPPSERLPLPSCSTEIYDLTVHINRILCEADEIIQRHHHFISDVSHELRNPLTALLGHTEILQQSQSMNPALFAESLLAIQQESQYMNDVVMRLLFLSRTNGSSLQPYFQRIRADELLQTLYPYLKATARKHDVFLKPGTPAFIQAEPGSVQQLLRIFFDNAVKYTPSGGTILLSCTTTADAVLYTLEDTGIGISARNQKHIFERCFRVPSSSRPAVSGTGLGLPIAQAIATANGATISVTSNEGKGTTIAIAFPHALPSL